MMPFIELGTYIRALFLTLLFVEVCLSVCLTIWSFLQKTVLPKLLAPLTGIIAIIFILPYSAYILAQNAEKTVEYVFVDRFFELPAVAVIAVTAVNALIIVGLILYFYRSIRNGISAFSVKQSFDKLKTGICFSYKNGMIKLVNRKMNELHGIITGKEMQNAKSFIETLIAGQLQPGVERLSSDGNIILRLPDMRVWSFSVRDMGAMFEITAADTTELYSVTEELNVSNDELREMNKRLQKYGENVDELTVARERLETKYRIHAELGKALLATRLFLQNNDGNLDEIIGIWKRNITVLGVDNSGQTEYDAIDSLFTAARAVGIKVEMSGELPKKEAVRNLFLETTAESLTNAVKHADAKYFSVTFSSDLFSFSASFSNDGIRPSENIREGGGLTLIRRKTEELGGRMSLKTDPVFNLTVTVPK